MGRPNTGPLRRVMRSVEGRWQGKMALLEVLECGHRQPPRVGLEGRPTVAARRRCRKCGGKRQIKGGPVKDERPIETAGELAAAYQGEQDTKMELVPLAPPGPAEVAFRERIEKIDQTIRDAFMRKPGGKGR